ncbi:hypothetical protein A1Q1_01149 [Trichosporon asahii var. asahii CBS 2479]|uniref:Uncharacterized protein n=1 Tax=Trichosporon asahii var. asahii (strain ATCC 90039 / CBS 2479 / JCM 2466 / KCTC 7840 / NBRC 103889/ NCYC 2677 / UAMH 7654) TaxID=1186058 RepID=J6F3C4_TRIAS|nr:hypothetical protein A1Q1_01149 [Trichosporon asahii var. asahii CBS 2479]EJT49727.1 hypothetical protein A1Q1_01149 [Trichosporon asahii var. asahii CBS 2479]
MVTTIDHLAFPHIIDSIWSYMTPPSAAAARGTSSEWRRKADKILQRHMVLDNPDGKEELRVKGFEDTSCKYPRYQDPSQRIPNRFRPLYPWPRGLLDLSQNIQILDIPRPWGVDNVSKRQLMEFLVRSGAHPSIGQLILDEPYYTDMYLRLPLFDLHPPVFFVTFGVSYPLLDELELNGVPRQIVINIDCPTLDMSPFTGTYRGLTLRFVLHLEPPSTPNESLVPELIVIFRRGERIQAPIDLPPDFAAARLARYLNHIWKFSPVTVVGIDDFFPDQAKYDEVKTDLMQRTALTEDFPFKFELLSSAEYKQRVDEELFIMQTVM